MRSNVDRRQRWRRQIFRLQVGYPEPAKRSLRQQHHSRHSGHHFRFPPERHYDRIRPVCDPLIIFF